ncbi:FG-GAP repeat domain-containing protein [Paraliomyxa miuraensis]|uniref:FG-GAP repeat domain-containing protein n=1 Tax=Paraliomyxa miuraensis TaxID=376150 RepID=UPI0022577032|nr:FG-GAP-like repeat-containing protein [Paraliomyxa miuraensis]MCX4244267.1 VCBS repeat-containing protein [Paraliomyxa miuraensis]
MEPRRWAGLGVLVLGCGTPQVDDDGTTVPTTTLGPGTQTGTQTGTTTGETDGTVTASGSATSGMDTTADSDTGPGILFDLSNDSDLNVPPIDMCTVTDDMNAVGDCRVQAPPDSFEPVEQWSFTPPGEPQGYVTPLVVNLTDDDGNGVIDMCDVPDVVLVAGASTGPPGASGHIYVLDGATGSLHFQIPDAVNGNFTPALGDIDGDGISEIVTLTQANAFVAFEHDGTKKWETPTTWGSGDFGQPLSYSSAAALADLDNDGTVEIVAANKIIDHDGNNLITLAELSGNWSATVPADLDGDGDLEVVLGHAAFHHDGSMLWNTGLNRGYPQVANLDGDAQPEVLLTNDQGLNLIEHTGAVTYSGLRPTGDPVSFTGWLRPATVHDFDGDGIAEFAVSSANNYTVYEANASIVWSSPVQDFSGIAAGTAFDFLGDGIAEAMYTDEVNLYVFDGMGGVLFQVPRGSGTLSEYPIVVDVDNDGSAEVLFVSNSGAAPTLQVIADIQDRWIQARRIWNQHAYHVTNVREDGTIPQNEPPHWLALNTFRTNAQIEGGGLCMPTPPG